MSKMRFTKSKNGLLLYVKSIPAASSATRSVRPIVIVSKFLSSVEAAEMSISMITHLLSVAIEKSEKNVTGYCR